MSKKQQLKETQSKHNKNSSSLLLAAAGLVLVAALLGLVWVATSTSRSNGGTPQVQVNTERIDLGKQIYETPVQASFEVKNSGTGTLVLTVPKVATLLEGC